MAADVADENECDSVRAFNSIGWKKGGQFAQTSRVMSRGGNHPVAGQILYWRTLLTKS